MGSYLSYYWRSTPSTEIECTETTGLCHECEPEVEEYDYVLNKSDPHVMYGLYMALNSGAAYDSTREIVTVLNSDGRIVRYKLIPFG